MTGEIKADVIQRRFPFTKKYNLLPAWEKTGFVIELSPMTEGIFLSRQKEAISSGDDYISLYLFGEKGELLSLNISAAFTLEEYILQLLSAGKKVFYIAKRTPMSLTLYLRDESYDSVADQMIPMLKKARDEETARLEKQIAGLYAPVRQKIRGGGTDNCPDTGVEG